LRSRTRRSEGARGTGHRAEELPVGDHRLHLDLRWVPLARGRIGDYMGRKKSFLIGLLGFAGASLLGGFAQNQQWLFGARALQGLFGALLAPARCRSFQ